MTIPVTALPVRMTRSMAAAYLSQHFFPVSPRTLERWPVATRRVNGHVLIDTADLLTVANGKLRSAPVIMAGRERKAA
jgi:hypothetical protein